MKAETKAKELVEAFTGLNSVKMSDYSRIEWPTAKLCALKAVDQVIATLNFCDLPATDKPVYRFWVDVRKEINKL